MYLMYRSACSTADTDSHVLAVQGVEFECDVTQYPSFLANLPTLQEPHYVLYTSDIDEETQRPWCPDCMHADPIVEAVIKETGGTLLKVKVSKPINLPQGCQVFAGKGKF